ncbi:MAG: response regulator [Cytophagales bacterium]|nr:response regulator [Cytophagales bacterium]
MEIDLAENGRIAVEKASKNVYDVILMDLQMPEMDGYDASRMIRTSLGPIYKRVPIIALTASAMMEVQKKVHEAGMNDFVTKPFNPMELYNKIERYVRDFSKA